MNKTEEEILVNKLDNMLDYQQLDNLQAFIRLMEKYQLLQGDTGQTYLCFLKQITSKEIPCNSSFSQWKNMIE